MWPPLLYPKVYWSKKMFMNLEFCSYKIQIFDCHIKITPFYLYCRHDWISCIIGCYFVRHPSLILVLYTTRLINIVLFDINPSKGRFDLSRLLWPIGEERSVHWECTLFLFFEQTFCWKFGCKSTSKWKYLHWSLVQ